MSQYHPRESNLEILSLICFGKGYTPSDPQERNACKRMVTAGQLQICGPMPLDGYASYEITEKGRQKLRRHGYRGSENE